MLAAHPCRSLCDWSATGGSVAARPLFRCAGCGSEWTRDEGWTPAQADGSIDPAVRAEAGRD